jgi:hypothetical protein
VWTVLVAGNPNTGNTGTTSGAAGADLLVAGGISAPISCSARPAPSSADELTPIMLDAAADP